MATLTQPIQPFQTKAPSIAISATSTASSAVQLPITGNNIRVINEGPSIAFLCFGKAQSGTVATLPTTTAVSVTSDAIGPGEDLIFSRDMGNDNYVSAICRVGGTAALTVYVGTGQ